MAEKRRIEGADLIRYRLPSDPRLSPDGAEVAFVVRRTDPKTLKIHGNIFVASFDGLRVLQFTTGDQSDSQPRWSPDGTRIAFVSDRGGEPAVWIIERNGGEARKLASFDGAPSRLRWSPDGSRIALSVAPKSKEDEKKDDEDWEGSLMDGVRILRRLSYRVDGQGLKPEGFVQIFTIHVATGETRQVTKAEADSVDPDWSPDGKSLVFVSSRKDTSDWEFWDKDLWIVDLEAGPERRLESKPYGWVLDPSWSPDGKNILFVTAPKDGERWTYASHHPWLIPVDGGEARDLMPGSGLHAENCMVTDVRTIAFGATPRWSPEGDVVFFLVSDQGSTHICACPVREGKPYFLLPEQAETAAFTFSAKGRRLVAQRSTVDRPDELYTSEKGEDGWSPWRRITRLNDALLAEVKLGSVEAFEVEGGDGRKVQAWAMLPPFASPDEPCPVLLEIHGGPLLQYGWTFLHEFQVLAAKGYAVVFANPGGSRGYGRAFAEAIFRDWGSGPFEDLMAVMDHVVAQGWADPERLGVLGGSYGGYMTNWIISHTKRFQAACTQRCVSNLYSLYGSGDYGFFLQWHMGADPQDDPEVFRRNSPIAYAKEVETPTLILHSDQDSCTPIEQAEQLFTALRMKGVQVDFARIEGEGHGLSRCGSQKKRISRLQVIGDWFDRQLAPAGGEGERGSEPLAPRGGREGERGSEPSAPRGEEE